MATPPGDCVRRPIELPEIRNEIACAIASRLAAHEWRAAHPDMKVLDAHCEERPLQAAGRGGERG